MQPASRASPVYIGDRLETGKRSEIFPISSSSVLLDHMYIFKYIYRRIDLLPFSYNEIIRV